MIGSTVSHYRILDRLGGGGMGVVYKAVDLKLDRPVALKFLVGQRGAPEEARRRFTREARAASALDHPNICTVYEIDETGDGALFIAMALCEGETLRERIARGPLAIPEAVGIAEQIAAGLAWAHERGIVHRDVKPANVMVTPGGRVKIVDFGIAKLADQSRITRAGVAVGTAAYMSPEQVQGQETDPRTDVWSLGVMIYEMVTGRPPFTGGSETDVLLAILTQAPGPMATFRSGVPPALERVVTRALAKPPDARYASMSALSADLQSFALPAPPPAADEEKTLLEIPVPSLSDGPVEAVKGPGSKVDRYEILELLGGGGMGVVYKARDTRLSRTVALKFLPPELTRDPWAKERFEQEARAASSLDHPNLCTILELGETPDGRLYIAMPCYDGETLRHRLERGPLPVHEAADIAAQIARGLAKAHGNGIVHRDIKPANLIVTADGVVKILDFGLAKLAGLAAVSRTGSSAGTPAYMSPEQARGDEVDARTDLWSLGVVLYEMLAGRRPFRGEREQTVIYSILHESAQPLRELRPEVPPELARIVERLLAKKPEDRYPSIEEPLAGLRALVGATATTGVPVIAPPPRRKTGLWLGGLAAAIVFLIAGTYLLMRGRGAGPLQLSFTQLTDQNGRDNFPSLSPDGKLFVFDRETSPGNRDIYLQRVGGDNPINLTPDSPSNDTQPAFSPDGQQIAFRSERDGGGIFVMGATGESVRRLTDFGYNPAWSPDGKEIAIATEGVSDPRSRTGTASQIWRIAVNTGERHLVPIHGDAIQPSWSPSGSRIAYWGLSKPGSHRVIWTVSARGGRAVQVTDDAHLNWSPVWSPDRRYLYFDSDRGGSMNLWRVPIAEQTGEVQGSPEPVTTPAPWSSLLSFSRDGRQAVYSTLYKQASLMGAPLAPERSEITGPLRPIIQGSRQLAYFRVSPDGQWIVFYSTSPQEDLFIVRTDGTGLRQLTNDVYKERNPSWSPDSRQILFYSDRGGRYEAWSIQADGSGLQQLTATHGEPVYYPVWSPDARWIVCGLGFTGPALIDLARPLAQRIPERLPNPPAKGPFFASSWSPDGKQLAGSVTNEGVFLYSFLSHRYERIVAHGEQPVWFHDGHRLLYMDKEIRVYDLRTKQSRLLLAPSEGSSFLVADLSPDDRMLYALQIQNEGNVWLVTMK